MVALPYIFLHHLEVAEANILEVVETLEVLEVEVVEALEVEVVELEVEVVEALEVEVVEALEVEVVELFVLGVELSALVAEVLDIVQAYPQVWILLLVPGKEGSLVHFVLII